MNLNLDQFAMNARRHANAEGYSDTLPVRALIAGLTVEGRPVTRALIVSAVAPTLYKGSETCLWLDGTLSVFKSSNWYSPDAPKWERITDYSEMFIESNSTSSRTSVDSLPLDGGTLGGPLLLFRDPTLSNEAATRGYVDNVVRLIAAGKLYIEHPVTTVAELRALDISTIPDEQVIYVEEARKMYAYDLQGLGADDGHDILIPASGIGRWFSTSPSRIDGGLI